MFFAIVATVTLLSDSMTVAEDAGIVQICALLTIDSGTAIANTVVVTPSILQGWCFSILLLLNLSCFHLGSDSAVSDAELDMNFTFVESSSQCVNLTIIDDTLVEGYETFRVVLALVTVEVGVSLNSNNTAMITIIDNEGDFLCLGLLPSK